MRLRHWLNFSFDISINADGEDYDGDALVIETSLDGEDDVVVEPSAEE